MIKKDNLHYSTTRIDGYNAAFNLIISEREAGKSTTVIDKCWKVFNNGGCSFLFRRLTADITELYVESIQEILRKFYGDAITVTYQKKGINEGAVKLMIDDRIFCYILSLSAPLSRLKSCMVPNLRLIVFDEFICNTRIGEKYLKNEFFKFQELYNTYQRECTDQTLKCYFLGNPYSLYNPYFVGFEVDVKKIKRGTIYKVPDRPVVVESYEITPELRAAILARNPLYQFDNSYKKYAFEGQAINDMNIRIVDREPPHFQLIFGFRMNGQTLGLFQTTDYTSEDLFYVRKLTAEHNRLDFYCFEFDELISRTVLLDPNTAGRFVNFKRAFRKRLVQFADLESYYLAEELYLNL